MTYRGAASLIAALVLLTAAASLTAAEIKGSEPPRNTTPGRLDVRLTVYTKLSVTHGSSGATTFTPSPKRAAAIAETASSLPSAFGPSCHENLLLYKIAVRSGASHAGHYEVHGWQCDRTVLFTESGESRWVSDQSCELLRAVQAAIPPNVGKGTRDAPCVSTREQTIVGKTLTAAQTILSAGGNLAQVAVTQEVAGRAVPPETVLSQTTGHWPLVPVTVAAPPASPCTASQLSAAFTGVYDGASQHLFAGVVVRDVSPRWCELLGPIKIVGLNAAGETVTNTASDTLRTPAYPTISNSLLDELSPNAPPLPTTTTSGGAPSGQFYPVSVFSGWVGLSAPDAAAGTCSPAAPEVFPVTWQLTIPGTTVLTVPNGPGPPVSSTAAPTGQPTRIRPLGSCGGGLGGTGVTVREGTGSRQRP